MALLEDEFGTKLRMGVAASSPLHANARPIPYGTDGHFRLAATSGTIAAALAANAQLFTMRWTHATLLCVILRLQVRFQPLTLFTPATLVDFGFDLVKATAVSAGGGGTAIAGSAVTKMRTSMSASNFGATDIRIATTGALTALTTLDANPIENSLGDVQRVNPAAATEEQRVNDPTLDFNPDIADGGHPIVLATNEGIVVRNRAVWPAAGTGIVQVRVAWAEVAAY
jgi:hypothetical protein